MNIKKLINNKSLFICLFVVFIVSIFSLRGNNTLSSLFNKLLYSNVTATDVRESLNFNYDWRFSKGVGYINNDSTVVYDGENPVIYVPEVTVNTPANEIPYSTSYVEGNTWSTVSLPHTYNDTDTFNNFMEAGNYGERSVYSGTAWYRKTFYVDESYTNKRLIIEFEGARQAAKIYVNGIQVPGHYQNGFVAFGYDITDYVIPGTDNQITVMVDNSYPYYIEGTNTDVIWHDSHWHPNFGGLYRNVTLHIVNDLHFTFPLYSFLQTEGTYIYTDNENFDNDDATTDSIDIHVDAEVINNSDTTKTFTVVSNVIDHTNNSVLEITSNSVTLGAGEKIVIPTSGTIINPYLWSDQYPYLYTVNCEILVNGEIIDDENHQFGIRTYRFTNNAGFYLNEHYTILEGFGQKATNEWAGLGSAYPNWMQDYTIKKMKDANANYIRWGHVAASGTQIEATDKYGILVTQPGVDGEGASSDSHYNLTSYKLRIETMRDMLIYFRNSTSIIMWEMGNQASGLTTTVSDTYLSNISGVATTRSNDETIDIARILYDLINYYDYGNRNTTRTGVGTYTKTAMTNTGSYELTESNSDRLITIRFGSIGVKDYIDVGESTEGGIAMKDAELGSKPTIEAEFNRLEARRGVWDTSTIGYENFSNSSTSGDIYKYQTSESFAVSQITKFATIYRYSAFTGGANWIFSDSTSHGRVTSEVARASGEVDATFLEKEAYYVDQVIWGDDPAVYIIGHWNYTPGTVKTIYAAAKNVHSVELFVNGVSKGRGSVSSDYLYTFNDIEWETGTIRIDGKDVLGNVIATYSITSHKEPVALRITPITNNGGAKATGSDVVLFDIEVVDEDGNRCITFDGVRDNIITYFDVNDNTGTSIWRGGYNSSIEGTTNIKSVKIESGIARVAVRTTLNAGAITLTATTTGLTSATATVNTTSINNTNGYSTNNDSTPSYSLTSLTYPGYGSGVALGIEEVATQITSSVLIDEFIYTGTPTELNTIADPLAVGSKVYNDSDITFTSVPYEYLNSEYLLLPSGDSGDTSLDLITFMSKRNIVVSILFDSELAIPSWLDTDDWALVSGKTVAASDGTIYNIYERELIASPLVTLTLGGNSDDGISGYANSMYIATFKETTKLRDYVFFNESFTLFDQGSITNGWHASTDNNDPIVAVVDDNGTVDDSDDNTYLRLVSASTENLAYMQKKFATQTSKFEVSFDVKVLSSQTNTWLRVWFGNGLITYEDDKDMLAIETYLHKSDVNKFSITSRPTSTSTTPVTLYSQATLNEWHNIKYVIDPVTNKFDLYLNDVLVKGNAAFLNGDIDINTIVIGTGKSTTSDFYIDNVKIEPIINDIITEINVEGNDVGYVTGTTAYALLYEINENSPVVLTTTEFYRSHITTFDAVNNCLNIAVTSVFNETTTYNICKSDTFLNTFDTIYTSDNNTTITELVENGDNVAYFLDQAAQAVNGGPAPGYGYVVKEFNEMTGMFEVSFKIKLTSNYNNTYIRVWLLNGPCATYDTRTNLGIETYFSRDGNNFAMIYRSNGSTNIEVANNLNINTWYTITYAVDPVNGIFNVYIGDENNTNPTKYSNNLEFYQSNSTANVNSIDRIVFGTSNNQKTEFYMKDLNISVDNPLIAINIDGIPIEGFSKDNYNYTYYSNNTYDENTEITVVTNEGYASHTVTPNYVDSVATIDVTTILGDIYTYTVAFEGIFDQVRTKTELQDLYDVGYAYSIIDPSPYAHPSRVILAQELIDAMEVINNNDATNFDITVAYYELDQAIQHLYTIVVGDTTSELIDIFYHSSDLTDIYEYVNILEEGVQLFSDGTETFTSIPYKYLNSEFIRLPMGYANSYGSFEVEIQKPITILIFKDASLGNLLAPGYTFTGDIVTTNAGKIYKVYKKDITQADIDNNNTYVLDLKDMVINKDSYNNVIAFYDTSRTEVNGTITTHHFIKEDFNNYKVNELEKAWTIVKTGTSSNATLETRNDLNILGTSETVMKLQSTATASIAFIYKQFAHIPDKTSFKYSVYLSPISASYDNKFPRVWVHTIKPSDDQSVKSGVMVESYLHTNYFANLVTGTSLYSFVTNNKVGKWVEIEYIIDSVNRKYTVYIDGVTNASLTNLPFNADSVTGALPSYINFGTGNNGKTLQYFKDIIVSPIVRDNITDILVSATDQNSITTTSSVTDFHELTSDYLYIYEEGSSLSTSCGTITTGSTCDINTTESPNYIKVTETDANDYSYTHKVYLETYVDKTNLVALIDECLNLKQYLYTVNSWANMRNYLTAAETVVADMSATTSSVTTAYDELLIAKNNLIEIANLIGNYIVTTKADKQYESFTSEGVYITNKSSFTARFLIHKQFSGQYSYVGDPHERVLTSSIVFPEGTKITLVDRSEAVPKIYYYIVTSADYTNLKQRFLFEEFTLMGTTDSNYQNKVYYTAATKTMYEDFYVQVDFENTYTNIETNEYILGIELTVGAEVISSITRYFVSSQSTTFDVSLSLSESEYEANSQVQMSIGTDFIRPIINGHQIIDTTLTNKNIGIVLSIIKQDGTLHRFKRGTVFTIGDSTCYVGDDGKCWSYLSDTNALTTLITADATSGYSFEVGHAKIRVETISSYDGRHLGMIRDTTDVDIIIKENTIYNLAVQLDNDNDKIIEYGIPKDVMFYFSTDGNPEDVPTHLTATLYKKTNNVYNEINLGTYVQNLTEVLDNNEYRLPNISAGNWNCQFENTLPKGTYRLTFKLHKTEDNTPVRSVDYNFIVK